MYLFVLLLPAAGAGLTGSKMARRVGGVDEFEFKAIGENHNQGVGFDIFRIPVFLWHSLLKLSCELWSMFLCVHVWTLSRLSCSIKWYFCTWLLFQIRFLLNFFLQRLGVEILVSGFVFEKEDFIRPWEGQNDNLERYNIEHFPSIILVPLVKEGGFT